MYHSISITNDLTEDDLIAAYELQQQADRAQRLLEIATQWTAPDPDSERQRIKRLIDSIEETKAA